ncbi:hypothetical protein [Luteococcus japonicus]|uniref:Aminoglycoside phosphotransferase n=1 Tax=Luteococcus japonicus LSP_Lj1 TaxID=1255658 RepID=A0A1R4KKE1_9ACTN|nr:hypothetical protein [Luteococcus japonicus]SJN44826.1 aminoglycoside phosphotransferase [Luteococcus japonicus LSP_Lj1]
MSIPSLPCAIPELVLREAAGQRVEAVWTNGLGGTTWQIGEGEDRDFIKMGPEHPEFDIAGEIQRLDWLAEFLPVPSLVSWGFDDDGVWIRTKGLPGSNAVAPRNVTNAAPVVPALGRGLRRFHDALPVDECTFDWSVESRSSLLRNPFEVSIPAPRAEHVVVGYVNFIWPRVVGLAGPRLGARSQPRVNSGQLMGAVHVSGVGAGAGSW